MNIRFLYDTAPQHLSQNTLLQNVRNNDSFIITVHLPSAHSSRISAKCVSHTVKPSRKYALRQVNLLSLLFPIVMRKGLTNLPHIWSDALLHCKSFIDIEINEITMTISNNTALLASRRRSTAIAPIMDAYTRSLHVGLPPRCM